MSRKEEQVQPFLLAICDGDEIFLNRLADYLHLRKAVPFRVQLFSNTTRLREAIRKSPAHLLLISETLYEPSLQKLCTHLLLLKITTSPPLEHLDYIPKFQSVDKTISQILTYYETKTGTLPYPKKQDDTVLIGIYSPVKRCLQTSFALLLGQLLSQKAKVLYLNFETFSGFSNCFKKETADLSDLLYFLKHDPDKFIFKLSGMVQSMNGLHIIPAALSFIDLASIPCKQWETLLQEIKNSCQYEYIVLDLSDYIQGLFELLRMCQKVYTITREEGISQAKIRQYEKVLTELSFSDVLEKTITCRFPEFQNLPQNLENLPYSDMAAYIKQNILEDFHELI